MSPFLFLLLPLYADMIAKALAEGPIPSPVVFLHSLLSSFSIAQGAAISPPMSYGRFARAAKQRSRRGAVWGEKRAVLRTKIDKNCKKSRKNATDFEVDLLMIKELTSLLRVLWV